MFFSILHFGRHANGKAIAPPGYATGCESGHVLSVQNAEKEDIWAFFDVLGGKYFSLKKEDMSSKKRMYGNPNLVEYNSVHD